MENRLQYLAHKTEDREQTVLQHLTGTSKLSEQFASSFGKGKQGEMAGYLHDIGKYSRLFQERIPPKQPYLNLSSRLCRHIQIHVHIHISICAPT